jgi:DNA-binding beta-propeller fold protein YncE
VTAIPLHGPTSVTVDRRDDVYVVDQGNDRVLKLGPNGRTLAAWGSRGSGLLQFNSPSDITVARDATIYVSDSGNKRVEPLRSGKQVEQYNYDVGAVALDGRGALYATDYGRYQILKISLASGDLLASLPIPWIEAGSRPFPAGIAVDGQGFIYVADREHSLIRKLSPTGRLLASIGASGSGPGQLNHPSDVAVDGRGHLYVADTENNRIQELSATGAPLRIWRSRSSGPGQFQRPVGVAVDASGNVYVAGYFDERVLKLSPSGRLLWSTSGLRPTRS